MREKTDLLYPFADLTIKQMIGVTVELLQEGLDAVSVSRTLKPKILGDSYSVPLVRDLLLSLASRVTAAHAQLLFWTEMNEFASGLQVWMIGMDYTRGSVLVMELINEVRGMVAHTEALRTLIIDANSPDLPETFK